MEKSGLKKSIVINVFFLVFMMVSISSCNYKTKNHLPLIPLQKGNFWKYRGSYNDKPVTCNIVVNDILKKGNLTFALMKGFPSDILGGEDWETTSWGLLAVGNEHYYKVSGPRIDSIRTIMLNEKSVQSCLVTDSDLFMEALNDTGQTFGEAAQLTRNDGNYFWRVTQKHAYEPSSIKGLKLMGPFDRFTLNYQTVADDITLDIVPGIGIVRYRYCHHGTPGELDMKLVDVGIQ